MDSSSPRSIKGYDLLEQLGEGAYDCCVFRELTPEERAQFGLPPREANVGRLSIAADTSIRD